MDRFPQGWRRGEIKVSSAHEDFRASARGKESSNEARATARAEEDAKETIATEGRWREEALLD